MRERESTREQREERETSSSFLAVHLSALDRELSKYIAHIVHSEGGKRRRKRERVMKEKSEKIMREK